LIAAGHDPSFSAIIGYALVIVETVFLSHCLLRLSHWWLQTRLSLALYTLLLTETSGSTYLGTVTDSPHHSKSATLYIKAAHSSFIPVPNFFCFRNALFILHRSSVGAAAWHIGCDDIRYGEGVLRVDLLRRLGLLWKLYLWLTFSQLVVLLNVLIFSRQSHQRRRYFRDIKRGQLIEARLCGLHNQPRHNQGRQYIHGGVQRQAEHCPHIISG
jgi:heme exporter protein D